MKGFVYKWTHKPTFKWYVGFHKGEPTDGYICSSHIKDQIKENPEDWERTIIDVGTAEEMYVLETEILCLFNARKDSKSFNMSNNEHGVIPGWNKGIPMKDGTKEKQRQQRLGKNTAKKGKTYPNSHSLEARKKKSLQMMGNTRNPKGKPWSDARRAAQLAKQNANLHS